jgi:hypothetical protein
LNEYTKKDISQVIDSLKRKSESYEKHLVPGIDIGEYQFYWGSKCAVDHILDELLEFRGKKANV